MERGGNEESLQLTTQSIHTDNIPHGNISSEHHGAIDINHYERNE